MNGGTFTPGQEKERAGIYFRFYSTAQQRLSVGERGTLALPLVLGWGPAQQFVEISSSEELKEKLNLDMRDPELLLLNEAMKKSKTVLLYKLNDGTKAKATISDTITATAKYGGAKGNNIQIRVSANVLDSKKKDVVTLVDNQEQDKQTVAVVGDLKSNAFVDFSGTGALSDTAGIRLTGGANGTITNEAYTKFLSAAETEYFDVIALPVDGDQQLKTTFASFVKKVRDEQGVKIQGVLPNYPGDYEGIINVTNAVVLENGQKLTPAQAVAWVAGASAGASIKQSLTFVKYEGAVDVDQRLDNEEIINRLNNGEFIFSYDARDKSVSVESDINSFVSVSLNKSAKFKQNKIIRVLDAINNDVIREVKALIKERKEQGNDIPATADGAQFIKTLIIKYLTVLQDGQAVENFDSNKDVVVDVNGARDGFIFDIAAQPIGSADKFYFNVEVR